MEASDGIYLFAKGQDLALSCQPALEESLAGSVGQAWYPTWVQTGGKVGQPWCFGTTLHGGKREGLKRGAPSPLGRDLRKERGKDNLPEAS